MNRFKENAGWVALLLVVAGMFVGQAAQPYFPQRSGDITQSALDMREITPSDDTDLAVGARAFQVRGSAGDVEVITRAGNTRVIPDVSVGERIECQIVRVKATNTTATGIWTYE